MTTKKKMLVSFSGGRTSAYMAQLLKQDFSDEYDLLFVFANTGEEHEATLRFVEACDRNFDLGVVWIEAVVDPRHGHGTKHRIVNFENASRSGVGSSFEHMIRKFGIPNQAYPHCTRELKLRPIYSYVRSQGWKKGSYQVAVGIRADEEHRRSAQAHKENIVYPLLDWCPVDKQDINEWWEEQSFSLNLEERWGNCKTCWKKHDPKLFANMDELPEAFDFNRKMEADYPFAGGRVSGGRQVFFRKNRSTEQLFASRLASENFRNYAPDADADAGCAESCEAFHAPADD